jgi:hypothetical protein
MLRVLIAPLLVGGLLLSLAHISEANHSSEETLCSICVVLHDGITLISIVVVFLSAVIYRICCYFAVELRLLYHLPSTGRSPPLI